jgi:hypothetical protein
MRIMLSVAAVVAATLATPAAATGVITCNAGPQSGWKSADALKAKLIKLGWKVRLTKPDGGCYEVYGTTPRGERVEAYFHPISFEKLYVARRGKILFRAKGY